ncbi:MAG TPA: WD40 repeat domain-containing protein [Thermotogota bacterium]|nr:WD40 repeat domain-containing protein [Thermotogota bacterium]HPJ89581.1 WD40 repeat domain-containing protein [Thermotogota bacterium]HPR97073.1 WD40 repeat domain-containing protein [Thermotogota bacterium]
MKKVIFLLLIWCSITAFSIPVILPTANSIVIPNAFSLDETKNHLYAGYSNGVCAVWNIATGKLEDVIRDLEVSSSILSVSISNDKDMLAMGHDDGILEIWNLDPNKKYGEFIRENNGIWDIIFTKDDKYIYTANSDGRLRKWDINTKILEDIFTRHRRTINSAEFSNDGAYLATGAADHSIVLWNVQAGEIEDVLESHTDWVTDLAFSPNDKYLVSASADKRVMVWAIPRGYQLRESNAFPSEVWSVEYINNEEVVLGEASGDLTLWNVETAREMRRVQGAHNAAIRAITYSSRSNQIFTASNDGTIKIWDDKSLNLIATLTMAGDGEWIGYMPLGKYVSSVNALTRDDFYILDNNKYYTFDNYRDFLMPTEYLPIGDIFGPEIIALNLQISPRNDQVEFQIMDDSKVSRVEEFNNTYEFDAPDVSLKIPFDIWERDSSYIDINAFDLFGNQTTKQYEVSFSGFRFYLKEDFENLPRNTLVVLKGIKTGDFVVEADGVEYQIPKDKLILSPYAPDIEVTITHPERGWTQTKGGMGIDSETISFDVVISDIIGVDRIVINDQNIDTAQAVKKIETSLTYPLTFGQNIISITATNMEQISSSSSITVIRTERIPPEILLPPIPEIVYSDSYFLSFGVKDNFEVNKVLVNNVQYLINKKEEEIQLDLPINRGENRFEIEVFDWFNNSVKSSFSITGARVMFAGRDGVKVSDEEGQTLDVLMLGDRIITFEETGRYFKARIGDEEGYVNSKDVIPSPPDIYDPGFSNLSAQIQGDYILVKGIVYDDVSISEIKVGGNRIFTTDEVNITISDYPVRDARFFEYRLKIPGEEIFPIEVYCSDETGREKRTTVTPKL